MVVKVGSAGHVVDSVIQSPQAVKTEKRAVQSGESGNDVSKQKSRDQMVISKKSTDRVVKSSEMIAEDNTRRANSLNKNKPDTQNVIQTTSAATVEIDGNEIIKDPTKEKELTKEAVQTAVDNVNESLTSAGAKVEFSYHEKTGRYSFKVLDDKTGEVIKEVPPEKSLDMVAKMLEMAGILVDEKR